MSEKMLNTRIQQKHDIEVNWSKAVNFIPKIGEIIVYDPDENHAAARVKIGDGVKTVVELAFIDDAAKAALFKEIDMVDEKVEALGQLVGDASISEQIEEALLKTQADWDVNDETNAAYVKNRTHYYETEIVVPETLIPGDPQNLSRYFSTFEVIDGADYLITIDGIDYEAKGVKNSDNDWTLIPKNDIAEDNQYCWFYIYVDSENSALESQLYAEDNVIEIKLIKKKILEEKYLPSNLKQINSNWNQQDPYQKDYIKERPFYEQYKKVYSLKEHLNTLRFLDKLHLETPYLDKYDVIYLYRTGLDGGKNLYTRNKQYLVVYNNQTYTIVSSDEGGPRVTLKTEEGFFEAYWEAYTYTQGFATNIPPHEIDNIDFVIYDPDEIEIKQLDPKFIPTASEEQLIQLLMDIDALPAMTDSNGAIFTHKDSILLI